MAQPDSLISFMGSLYNKYFPQFVNYSPFDGAAGGLISNIIHRVSKDENQVNGTSQRRRYSVSAGQNASVAEGLMTSVQNDY